MIRSAAGCGGWSRLRNAISLRQRPTGAYMDCAVGRRYQPWSERVAGGSPSATGGQSNLFIMFPCVVRAAEDGPLVVRMCSPFAPGVPIFFPDSEPRHALDSAAWPVQSRCALRSDKARRELTKNHTLGSNRYSHVVLVVGRARGQRLRSVSQVPTSPSSAGRAETSEVFQCQGSIESRRNLDGGTKPVLQ